VSPRLMLVCAVVAFSLLLPLLRHHGQQRAAAAPTAAFPYVRADTPAAAGSYAFDASVTPVNRQAFLDVVTRVRPEAARLFDRVDGLVTLVDGAAPAGALGVTMPDTKGYTIQFRFGPVFHELGQRGFDRLVEHEMGHVVDHALLSPALREQLDAQIPAGVPCTGTARTGSCAPREERFAETFAKWASGDIGVELYAGYAVPPPADLQAWGAPLAAIAAGSD
jgi:hypothetical protein